MKAVALGRVASKMSAEHRRRGSAIREKFKGGKNARSRVRGRVPEAYYMTIYLCLAETLLNAQPRPRPIRFGASVSHDFAAWARVSPASSAVQSALHHHGKYCSA